MSKIVALNAEKRERVGKGAARKLRRDGLIAGVVYGDKKESLAVSFKQADILKQINSGSFLSTIYEIAVDGSKDRAIARDLQLDVVKDYPLHIDFMRIKKGAKVTLAIPVHFINEEECAGLKKGGALNIVRHEIELACEVDAIPSEISIDIAALEIGDSVHISEVTLPEGVEPTIDRDFTILTIAGAGPTEEEEEAAAAEAAEALEAAEAAEGEEGEDADEGEG